MEFWLGLFLLVFGAAIIAIIGWAFSILFYVVLAAIGVRVFKGITK